MANRIYLLTINRVFMYKYYFLLCITVFVCSYNQVFAAVQSHKSIQTAVYAFLQEETKNIPDSEFTVRPLDTRLRLSKCSSPLEIFWPLGKKKFGGTTVGIRCAGDKPWKIYIGAYIHIYKDVWVANTVLQRGQSVSKENIIKERRDVTKMTRGYVPASSSIFGQRLKRNIRALQVLTDNMLEREKLVKRGDRITIVSKSGNIVVQANGVALGDGGKGDRIRVKNISSKREIEAYVSDKHRVLLSL